jgi:hypothetical protein
VAESGTDLVEIVAHEVAHVAGVTVAFWLGFAVRLALWAAGFR